MSQDQMPEPKPDFTLKFWIIAIAATGIPGMVCRIDSTCDGSNVCRCSKTALKAKSALVKGRAFATGRLN
jgi:hypothetical protein